MCTGYTGGLSEGALCVLVTQEVYLKAHCMYWLHSHDAAVHFIFKTFIRVAFETDW